MLTFIYIILNHFIFIINQLIINLLIQLIYNYLQKYNIIIIFIRTIYIKVSYCIFIRN